MTQVVLVESADADRPHLVVTVKASDGRRFVVLTADQARTVAYQMRLLLDRWKAKTDGKQHPPAAGEVKESR